jgi:hypothetical protein
MKLQDADDRLLGLQILTATLATDGSGDGTAVFPNCRGRLYGVQVGVADAALDAGADWTLSGEISGTLMTKANDADFYARPRTVVQDSAGADIAGSMEAPLLLGEDVTLTVANGGASKGAITPATVRLIIMRGLS